MLPIITYKRTLDQRFEQIPDEEILEVFEVQLKLSGVDKITLEKEGVLLFKNNFFSIKPGGNWSRWVGIRRGKIELIKSQHQRVIRYSFDTLLIWIAGLIAGTVFFAVSQSLFVGIFGFAALGGLNLLIAIVQQSDSLTEIVNAILAKKAR